jgi:hypothetical protein
VGKRGRAKRLRMDLALGTIGKARTVAYHPQRAGRRLSRLVLGRGRLAKVKRPLRYTPFGLLRG